MLCQKKETQNHLLIHCLDVNSIWSKALEKLALTWVAPRIACDLLVSDLGRDLGRR